MKHEAILYPPEERIPKKELEYLFTKYYIGLRTIGVEDLPDKEMQQLEALRESYGMGNYSNN